MSKKDFAFRYPLRVRWAETDAQGVVFNARYLETKAAKSGHLL